ncbi:MAG: ABC transporter substrate-binding protein [Clostridia bacterium]|nr:ABC transporter substrate-binding protein [Clostridia bacterium]
MKHLKKFMLLVLAAALVLSTFAACGGDVQEKPQPSTSQEPSTGTESTGTETETTGLSRIVVIAQNNDLTTLDPHQHNDLISGNVTRMLYDTLIRLNDKNEYVPCLAQSWEYLDKNTVELKLTPDVQFHDGHVMTSEDVKYSLERQKASSFCGYLLDMITAIEIVDELTLKLTVVDESAALLSSLAHQCSSILPKEYTEKLEGEGKAFSDAPCGTGPYKFDYWNIGDECQIVRFENYFDEAYAAKNEGLKFRYIAEDNSRVIALETGEVDMILRVPSTSVASLEGNSDVKVLRFESCDLNYISPNCSGPLFSNEKLRQAIAHCIDRDAMIQVQCNGNAVPNFAPIGIAAIGYSEPATKREYDLEKAKQLLVEAGYPDGFEFTLSVWGDLNAKSAQVLQAACQQIGVKVNIEILDNSSMVDKCGGAKHDAGMDNWTANSEPDNTYRPWFSRELIGAGGYNWSCYPGEEIEALMEKALSVTDPAERQSYYTQINDFVAEHAVVWPLFSAQGMVATRSNVDGIQLYPTMMHLFQFVTIAE